VLLRELVAARKAAGITQQQLAELLGKPQSFVSDMERGQRRIDVVEFLAVVRALDADPYKILATVEHASN